MLLGRILRADSGVEGNQYLEHSSRKVFPVQAWECMKGCSKNKPRVLGQSSWPEEQHCATVSPWLQQLLLDTGCGRGSPVEKRGLRRPTVIPSQSFLSSSTATGGLRGIAGAVSPVSGSMLFWRVFWSTACFGVLRSLTLGTPLWLPCL